MIVEVFLSDTNTPIGSLSLEGNRLNARAKNPLVLQELESMAQSFDRLDFIDNDNPFFWARATTVSPGDPDYMKAVAQNVTAIKNLPVYGKVK